MKILSAQSCTIKFVRGSKYVDALRSYKLFINGTQVGIIARNAVLEVEVPSGALTIEAWIDWARSRPLKIEVAPGARIRIDVSNNWGALLGLWAVTFGFRSYLALKQLPSS